MNMLTAPSINIYCVTKVKSKDFLLFYNMVNEETRLWKYFQV